MLVDDSNYATLDSIVKELALIQMNGTDPVQIHSTKLATPDHRLSSIGSVRSTDAGKVTHNYRILI